VEGRTFPIFEHTLYGVDVHVEFPVTHWPLPGSGKSVLLGCSAYVDDADEPRSHSKF
jgi:hypothetical protein